MDSQTYHTLTAVPLLKGMNGSDLNHLLSLTSMKIETLEEGEVWVHQGETYRELTFLLSGTLQSTETSPDGTYTFTEFVEAPYVLELDRLYGMNRTVSATYRATSNCHLMTLSKGDMDKMMSHMEVFRLNILNHLCTIASRRQKANWQTPHPLLWQRIGDFFLQHCKTPQGAKQMHILMKDLGNHMGATRSLIGTTLHKMQDMGLLTMQRGYIEIPEIENFLKPE